MINQQKQVGAAQETFDAINVPVHRASTILFANSKEFLDRRQRLYDGYSYGLYGTPTSRALEKAVADIEGGTRCVVVPSGLAALTHSLLALCKTGDHVLAADCIYGSTRAFLQKALNDLGISVSFFPSGAGSIHELIQARTKVVLLESPGYYTMEIQDIEPIAREAHAAGALVLIDNSWGFAASKMFDHGVDVCCTALSKYAAGHADLCMGAITVKDEGLFRRIKEFVSAIGAGVSSDDAYMALRGLATLETRLAEHARRGLSLSNWLLEQPGVERVLNPALVGDPYHERFMRYFSAGNGLVSVLFRNRSRKVLTEMIDSLTVFRIGASWGSSHSLVALAEPAPTRSIDGWAPGEYVVRFHVGFERMDDLFSDIRGALDRLEHAPPPGRFSESLDLPVPIASASAN